jgi:hypothetical protein
LKNPKYIHILLRGQKQNMERFIYLAIPYKTRQTIFSYTPLKTRYNKTMLNPPKLPIEEVIFLSTLTRSEMESRLRGLWKAGWSLGVIGGSLSPAVPKTTIHFWVRRAPDLKQLRALPLPPPKSLTTSVPTKHAPRLRSVSPGVPPELRIRLRELSALSKRYRAKTSPTSPLAQANNELTQIARQLKNRGVPTAAIAEAAGVTYRAMARRLSQ